MFGSRCFGSKCFAAALVAVAVTLSTGYVWAENKSTRDMSARVDELIRARWDDAEVQAADRANDAEFHRRVHLDLCGLIPTVAQTRQFLADESPDKRERLIDSLLGGPNFPTHLAGMWRRMLLPDETAGAQAADVAGFQAWLRDQFLENHRYDNIVADLLVSRGSASGMRPTLFYTAAALKPETLATTSSRVFLGVQIGSTMPRPNNCPQTRLTAARARNGLSREAIQMASCRRRLSST